MEVVAYLAGEPWTDHPECTDYGIGAYVRTLNDSMPDKERQRLVPFIPRLIGTNTPELRERRIWLATDRVTRTLAPVTLRKLDLNETATLFEDLDPIIDPVSGERAARAVGYLFRETATIYGRVAEMAVLAAEGDPYYLEALFDGAAVAASHHAIITHCWDESLRLLNDLIKIR